MTYQVDRQAVGKYWFGNMPKSFNHSLLVDHQKIRLLRQSLGWTQEYASVRAGYSTRLIRKLECGGKVRPETLVNVLQCYQQEIGNDDWTVSEFLLQDEASGEKDSHSSELDQQRQILRMQQWYATIYNDREIHRVAEFIAPEMTYQHGEGDVHVGIDFIREIASAVLTGFNPLTFEFPHSFYSDGYVHTFWKLRMKHVGEFSGVEATGKWVTCRGNSRVRIVDDKMVDAEDNWDVYDVIRQLQGESPKWY
ncbi:ester cyclase [Rubripirellula obstinata]|uniref:ester cyclase n=1 Tax=Rubripirellula obstinata TaxID=406547 RepID=UPI00138FADDD|nr:ester cyclase [Rubripirellula obstinata]